MECGLVLETLVGDGRRVGGGGGPGFVHHRLGGSVSDERGEDVGTEATCCPTSSLWSTDCIRERVAHLLAHFHLDNQYVVERVAQHYYELYERRKRRKLVVGSANRDRVAMVYSIVKVLHQEGMPRPVRQVAAVCGMPRAQLSKILRVQRELKVSDVEKRGERRGSRVLKDEYTEAKAEDYVNTLCLHLNIPFAVGQQAERILQTDSVRWRLYGRKPQHLAGAALEKVLLSKGMPSQVDNISRELDCNPNSVRKMIHLIPTNLCWQ